jgi:N4-gp56 family major capsid protein
MPLKSIIELADTTSSTTRGDSSTTHVMEPRVWLKSILDAAKTSFYHAQFAYQTTLGSNQKDVVIPKRRKYIGSGSFAATAAEGSAVNYTTIDNLSGVVITPVPHSGGVALSNHAVRVNALDLVKAAREELVYMTGDAVDLDVRNALIGDGDRALSTKLGTQSIYGGDAFQASEIAAGDVITTDMIAKAKRYLQSTTCRYWTYGTGEAVSSESKNPWSNEPGSPFVTIVAPEQEEAFLTDSQFVNAAEYGSDKVIRTGEIGSYLGIKIVVSPNTRNYNAAAVHADTSTCAVAQHRCVMFKANKAVALAWGMKPRLVVFDYPTELEKRLVVEQSYKSEIIHPDAIVHINVADT